MFTRFNPGDKFCVEKSLDCAAAAEGNLGELLYDGSARNSKKDFIPTSLQSESDSTISLSFFEEKKIKSRNKLMNFYSITNRYK